MLSCSITVSYYYLNPDLEKKWKVILTILLSNWMIWAPILVGLSLITKKTNLIAVAITSIYYIFHCIYLESFLVPGLYIRMLKASGWVILATGIAVAIENFRKKTLLQTILWVLILTALIERRMAYKTEVKPTPFPTIPEPNQTSLLFVSIENLSTDVLLQLIEEGKLPFFKKIYKNGSWARIKPIYPYWKIPMWASLTTGVKPYKHKLFNDTAVCISTTASQVRLYLFPKPFLFGEVCHVTFSFPPLWDIFNRLGINIKLVGEWHDLLPYIYSQIGSISIHDAEIIFLAISDLTNSDREHIEFIHKRQKGELFPAPYEIALVKKYIEIDQKVEKFWNILPQDRVVIVANPYGPLRGKLSLNFDRRESGLLIMYGEKIIPGTHLINVNIWDIVPTVYYLKNIPIARELDGEVLTKTIDSTQLAKNPIVFIPTIHSLIKRDVGKSQISY